MADVTDPLPADRTGIDRAGGQDAGRLQVGTSTCQCAGQVVVALAGELDLTDAVRIDHMVTTVAIRVPRLIVDLAALPFTDCAGMRALAAAAKQARQAGGGLVLAAPRSLVLRVLDLTGLMTGVPLFQRRRGSPGSIAASEPRGLCRYQTRRLLWPGCPLSGQDRQQEEGQRGPHQQPTMADTEPRSP